MWSVSNPHPAGQEENSTSHIELLHLTSASASWVEVIRVYSEQVTWGESSRSPFPPVAIEMLIVQTHIQSSLCICGGLVPGPPPSWSISQDNKICRCSTSSYKMVQYSWPSVATGSVSAGSASAGSASADSNNLWIPRADCSPWRHVVLRSECQPCTQGPLLGLKTLMPFLETGSQVAFLSILELEKSVCKLSHTNTPWMRLTIVSWRTIG